MLTEATKVVAESQIGDIRDLLANLEDHPLVEYVPDIIEKLKSDCITIEEEVSTGDWTRIGVMAGLLWYKLDTIARYLSDMLSSVKGVERNTGKS